jgi:hypothetical protein
MASLSTTETEKTMKAAMLNTAVLWLRSCSMESRKKLTPTTPSRVPMMTEATSSALPWPKGCSLSPGLDEIQNPTITTREVRVSERVCQASATMATEPAANPTHNFNPNSAVLTIEETIPSRYPSL